MKLPLNMAIPLACAILYHTAMALPSFFTLSSYAPTTATCPSQPCLHNSYKLVRTASDLSSQESDFYQQRSAKAAAHLRAWVSEKVNPHLRMEETFDVENQSLPVLALASSGGGIRAMLSGAGLVSALDDRSGSGNMSGLYQSLTYHAGHDGGALLVAALAGNNYPTIETAKSLWKDGLGDDDFLPVSVHSGQAYGKIALDLAAKQMAGYEVGFVDVYGALLAYISLFSSVPELYAPYGHSFTSKMSSIASLSNFTTFNGPFPIITAYGLQPWNGQYQCYSAGIATPSYEFTPYEFGSWDNGVRSFMNMPFWGTTINDGRPVSNRACMNGLDNLGFVLGITNNMFNSYCHPVPDGSQFVPTNWGAVQNQILSINKVIHEPTFFDEYAIIPNPFFNSTFAPSVSNNEHLYLVGGQQGNQSVPLWPLIQPARGIDIIIANDNTDEVNGNGWPDGTQLYGTFQKAMIMGIDRMPMIPPPQLFRLRKINEQAMTVFGCDDSSKITIIYIPNRQISYASNRSAYDVEYSPGEVEAMLDNGQQIAEGSTEGEEWPSCVACMILMENVTVPSWCEDKCFKQYCWRE